MFWELTRKTIRAKRGQWVTFALLGLGFLLLYITTFPAVQKTSADYDKIVSTLPKGVLTAFNITQTTPSLMGYLSSKHFGFLWALMIILLMSSYASYAIAKEIETKTMGLLLSQPVSRLKIYWSRFLSGLLGLTVFIVFSEVLVWPLAHAFNYSIALSEVMSIAILGFAFGAAVLGLGMFFSAGSKEGSRSTAYLSTVMLVMYVAYLTANLEPRFKSLEKISIFNYFKPGTIVSGQGVELNSLFILLAIGAASAILGSTIFNKRDLNV